MSPARGQPSLTMIDKLWPWQVELTREAAWGDLSIAIGEWTRYRVPKGDCRTRQPPDHSKVRYAFRTREQAEAFQGEFGGELRDAAPKW